MKLDEKRFVIRKYVLAVSAKDAIRRERKQVVDEVYLADDQPTRHADAIGFLTNTDPNWRPDEVIRGRATFNRVNRNGVRP